MIGFLKSFFGNEKSPEEQALLAAQHRQERDVLTIPGYETDDMEEKSSGGCGGCGNCHCGNAQNQ